MIKNIFTLFFLCFVLISCKDESKKEETFSPIPHIWFKSISQTLVTDKLGHPTDSIAITIDYKDGDSDMGIHYEEIDKPPFQFRNSDGTLNKYHYNYWIEGYQQINGTFQLVEFAPTLNGIYPIIGNKGGVTKGGEGNPFIIHTKTATQGEMTYSILFPRFIPLRPETIKFRITIVDRALNESNTIETSSITINQ
jgi:hypothetical protein